MKLINLTDHNVNICDRFGNVIRTYEPSGMEARRAFYYETVEYIEGVPVVVRKNEHMVNLPDPQEGVGYIVSTIVLEECADRTDLYAPARQYTRDGRVIGCMAFMSNR